VSQTTPNTSDRDIAKPPWEGIWDDLGLENGYAGFSCPLESLNESLAQTIAGEYARSVLGVFVERFAHVLSKNGLDDLFSGLLNADLPLELAWSSDLGNLYRATKLGDEDHAMKTAGAFALLASAKGFGGEWQLELSKATRFFWDDWVLPVCDKLTVIAGDANASIKLSLDSDQTHVAFVRSLDGWNCQTPTRAVRLPSFGSGRRRLVLLPRSAVLDIEAFRDDDFAAAALERFSPALIEILTQALDLLEEHLSHYFHWVVRIIRRVAVLHFERNVLYSGTHEHQYRTIHISDNSRVLSVAEMLIHEASHQYFELLNKLGPTVDPAHTELYYSPVKQCERPLHKILFAYHAFANVMLFYRGVAERDLTDSSSAKFQNVLKDELRQLEQPLLENKSILPIGRALVGPLIERSVCQ
jgi:HEXXH motif-containing protein